MFIWSWNRIKSEVYTNKSKFIVLKRGVVAVEMELT